MNQLRHEAQKLRDQGYSYKMIFEKIGVSPSTMSYWFRGRPFTPNPEVLERIKLGPIKAATLRRAQRIEHTELVRRAAIVEIGSLSKRDLFMVGIGLYIGEGSKSIENVRIMNSDPDVIRLSMRWLKETCGVGHEDIMISLFLYPDSDVETIKKYWQEVTDLPMANFRKTTIDTRANKRKKAAGKLPYGTVQLRVNANGDPNKGVALFRRINAWMDVVLCKV